MVGCVKINSSVVPNFSLFWISHQKKHNIWQILNDCIPWTLWPLRCIRLEIGHSCEYLYLATISRLLELKTQLKIVSGQFNSVLVHRKGTVSHCCAIESRLLELVERVCHAATATTFGNIQYLLLAHLYKIIHYLRWQWHNIPQSLQQRAIARFRNIEEGVYKTVL